MDYKPAYKAARAIKGLTQESAATLLGVAAGTLSDWENNKTEPTASQLFKMSALYGISCDKLVGAESLV